LFQSVVLIEERENILLFVFTRIIMEDRGTKGRMR